MLYRPYRLRQHNMVEWVLALMNTLMLLMGMLFYIDEMTASVEVFALVVIFIVSEAAVRAVFVRNTPPPIRVQTISVGLFFMVGVLAMEMVRFVKDRPVDRDSTVAELFEVCAT